MENDKAAPEIDEEPDDESTYCECGETPIDAERMGNTCFACGKPLE